MTTLPTQMDVLHRALRTTGGTTTVGPDDRALLCNYNEPRASARAASPPQARRSWAAAVLGCLTVWLVMRIVFFYGIQGSDDLDYMRFAALWDRAPINHWESRLLANALMGGAMKLFGINGVAAALPSMAASLVIFSCVLYWCRRYADVGHAWWAGLTAAVLPVDVHGATTPSAYPLMTAFMTVGTLAFMQAPQSRRARLLAAWALAAGVVTHLAGVYYVACLALAALGMDRRRFWRPVVAMLVAAVSIMAADMAVFHFAFGDALGRFRLAMMQTSSENPLAPLYLDGRFNWEFVIWPISETIFSKTFGVALGVVGVWGIWNYRRLPESSRLLLATAVVFWLWMSFGSQVPWAYKPFWRMLRFLAPLTLPVSILLASAVVTTRRRALARLGGTVVLAICLLNLAVSGSWGQSVQISRELLAYAADHPQTRFITDVQTLNEMYVLNGMQLPANVVTTDTCKRSQLLNRGVPRLSEAQLKAGDAILANPLNTARRPDFAAFIGRHAGRKRYETQPAYRMIGSCLPPLRAYPWLLRKPPAQVLDCLGTNVP